MMSATPTTLPSAAHIGRVSLSVNDLERERSFYETVVGLDRLTSDDERAVLGAGDDALLELVADPDAPERGRSEAGLFHTAFLVPNRAALADALTRATDAWHLSGASDHHVSEALYLRDPEGNGIEIYRDRPREAWPIEADGQVRMDTLPLDLDDLRREATGATRVPEGTSIGHVHLEAVSIPDSRAFYVEGLGLGVRQEWGDSALFLAAGDYHHHVGLNRWNQRSTPRAGRGLDWFEVVVPDRKALDAVRSRLGTLGIETVALESGFEASDPNGIRVRVRTE
jgi:catechol 2,3-dioxygenase